jgi:hypothetical protein
VNQELYNVYLEGFQKGYWELGDLRESESWYVGATPPEWQEAVDIAEVSAYSTRLGPEDTFATTEFQAAMKKWDQIKDSPLWKALE